MEKSLFEQMGGTYTQVGDYLLPCLSLSEEEQKPVGIWGAGLRWRPLTKSEALTEPAGETSGT